MKKQLQLLLPLVMLSIASIAASAQTTPVTVAVFPLKNLYGEVKYDSLIWKYTDSLVSYLSSQPGAGTVYNMVPAQDVHDQMLAMNIDIKSPSYETDLWNLAKLLGAQKIIWGTYLVKYEKANIDAKIYDVKLVMADPVNFANKIRLPYADALSSVTTVGDKLLPGLK